MPPQGLMEHRIQVRQLWQVILGNYLITADLLDFLVKAILMCKRCVINSRDQRSIKDLQVFQEGEKQVSIFTCFSGCFATSYMAHSVVTKVVSAASITASHTSISNCSSFSVFSASRKSRYDILV